MKIQAEDLIVLGAAGLVVWAILKFSGATTGGKSGGGGFSLEELVSSGNGIGAYIPTEAETEKWGVTAGSLFNTGSGGGYLTSGVKSEPLFSSLMDPGIWNPTTGTYSPYAWPAYTTARDR